MADPQRRRLTVGVCPDISAAAAQDGSGATVASATVAGQALFKTLQQLSLDENHICVNSKTDTDLRRKRSFAEKDRECSLEPKPDLSISPIPGVEFTCKKGLKPESPNQDSFVAVHCPSKYSLYGVFDGHGPNGHDVSDLAVKFLVKTFFEQDYFSDDAGKAFTVAFKTCQQEIEKAKVDATSSGSTCTMAFHNIEKDVLTLAHVGDSRGVLYSFASDCSNQLDGNKAHIKHETEDHKPNLPKEKARIEAGGGRVVFDGYFNHRVFAKAGMYPGLNMSRALGDILAHKEAGLTAEPEVKEFNLKDERAAGKKLFLLICSDGVWEFIESQGALKEGFVDTSSSSAPTEIPASTSAPFKKGVDALAKKSWEKWMADSDNEISDDITVIAAVL